MAVTIDLGEMYRRAEVTGVEGSTPCRIADAAWLLDLNRTVVDKWVARGTFPTPDGTFPAGSTPWWYWRTIAAWAHLRAIEQLGEVQLP